MTLLMDIPAMAPRKRLEEGEGDGVVEDEDMGEESIFDDVSEEDENVTNEDEVLDEEAEKLMKLEYIFDVGEAIADRADGAGALMVSLLILLHAASLQQFHWLVDELQTMPMEPPP
ncbi:hypothetical protein ACHAP3_001562 [Botrytis cinerea]